MILAVDTSSKACSCALIRDKKLISESYINTGLTHSTTLMMLIEQCLKGAGIDFSEVNSLAVSTGPGSYTGLRIGISAVKGLAFERNLPCFSVSTLMGLAYNVKNFDGVVLACLDARVKQVFAGIFKIENGVITRTLEDTPLKLSELSKHLPHQFLAVGDGAELVKTTMTEHDVILAPEHLLFQRASSVGFAVVHGDAEEKTSASLVPHYLRLSQAERERAEREQKKEEETNI